MLSRLLGSVLLAGLLILPASAQTGGGFTVPLPMGDVFVPNDAPPDETGSSGWPVTMDVSLELGSQLVGALPLPPAPPGPSAKVPKVF